LVGPAHWSGDSRRSISTQDVPAPQIWKMTPSGEQPVQITKHGSLDAQESPEGRRLLYRLAQRCGTVRASGALQADAGSRRWRRGNCRPATHFEL
jgi:hypothetical protein